MAVSMYLLILSAVILFVCELGKTKDSSKHLAIPTVRYSILLPNFLNRLIFFIAGPSLIHYGYNKYKDMPYRVLKADGDLIVLPCRYADELRQHPPSKLSSLDAQFENVLGEYTNVLVESRLPSFTVTKRLIPSLNNIVPRLIDELNHLFDTEVPKCDGHWVAVKPYDMLLRLLARSTSRIIAGEEISRNKNWIEIVTNYTVNVGITIVLLRPFPDFIRPLVARFLPSVRKLNKQMKYVKEEFFIPMIRRRQTVELMDPSYTKPDDFLQWMLDLADNDRDIEPDFLAQNIFIIMSLAVVHTSTMALTQTLYDLILHPEYIGPLREEISQTLKNGWENGTFQEFLSLCRLDSFLRESQRFNPSSEVNFHRITKTPLTLSDGFFLPKGIHICFPSRPLSHDPSIVPRAEVFDGFRWSDGAVPKSLITIGVDNMHFGFGRQACPGRAFAATAMKAILSRLISEYDVRFEERVVRRPANIVNGEQIMPNMKTLVFIRKRKDVGEKEGLGISDVL